MNATIAGPHRAPAGQDLHNLATQAERAGIRILATKDGEHFATTPLDRPTLPPDPQRLRLPHFTSPLAGASTTPSCFRVGADRGRGARRGRVVGRRRWRRDLAARRAHADHPDRFPGPLRGRLVGRLSSAWPSTRECLRRAMASDARDPRCLVGSSLPATPQAPMATHVTLDPLGGPRCRPSRPLAATPATP